MFRSNKDIKPRKKSYYSFSKNYPSRRTGTRYAIGETRARRKRERQKNILFFCSLILVFVLVFSTASVLLMLSRRPLDGGDSAVDGTESGWRAVYMPADTLSGGIAFDLFCKTLTDADANAVLLDFKDATGHLCTDTPDDTASAIGAATGAQTAADTVARLRATGYRVILRISCFRDPLAAAQLPSAAVTEADGTTIWLDDSAQNYGEPWLNPYSVTAVSYLLQVVDAAMAFGADMLWLTEVSFPDGRYAERAFFPGEAESLFSRNAVLHDFIDRVKAAAGDLPVTVEMPAAAAFSGDAARYGGGIFDSAADASAVDLRRAALTAGEQLGTLTYSAAMTPEELLLPVLHALQAKAEENYRTKTLFLLTDASVPQGISNFVLFP